MKVDSNAWSDSQMRSKIWLANVLEGQLAESQGPHTLWVFGAWYGVVAEILLIRGKVRLEEIHLFDIDPSCERVARALLNHWICQGIRIFYHVKDCERMKWSPEFGQPDLVINTSCEHFNSIHWLGAIPKGTMVVAQSTDMAHPTHKLCSKNLESFKVSFEPYLALEWADELKFAYSDRSFSRFMIIGERR